MISKQKLSEWINLYLQHIEEITPEFHVEHEEGYKFKSVNTFQQNFNLEAPDLRDMLDRAIYNNNLVTGAMYFPKRVLLKFAEEYEVETRSALSLLFDESGDIKNRINEAEDAFKGILKKWNSEKGDSMEHTFISLRFLSLLLGYRYPEKYNAMKPREWNIFYKFLDEDFRIPNGTSSGERYIILSEPIEMLRHELQALPEIQKIRDQLTRGLEFTDSEYRWLTQDVIYVTARIMTGRRGAEAPQQEGLTIDTTTEQPLDVSSGSMEFPLEEYLEDFMVRNWNNINFGEKLKLYIDEEGSPAQQYPTSEGYIDLLALDEHNNFVVIELKKGRTNQQVVGQILGYVGWVKKNLAEENQKVRGIIIASDGNGALMDAVSTVSNFISVKYYRVKFSFENPN